jgi:hypothetical protein
VDGLKGILRAGINQPKQALDNGGCSSISFKIHKGFAFAGAGDLGWFLRVIGKVLDIEA